MTNSKEDKKEPGTNETGLVFLDHKFRDVRITNKTMKQRDKKRLAFYEKLKENVYKNKLANEFNREEVDLMLKQEKCRQEKCRTLKEKPLLCIACPDVAECEIQNEIMELYGDDQLESDLVKKERRKLRKAGWDEYPVAPEDKFLRPRDMENDM